MRFWSVIAGGVVLAGFIVAITLALTRVKEVEALPIDSDSAEMVAGNLQAELDRLYSRYFERLDDLAEDSHAFSRSVFTVEGKAREIVGVKTISWLAFSTSKEDNHIEVRERIPRDGFDTNRFPKLRGRTGSGESEGELFLGKALFSSEPGSTGWLRRPLDVFYFWKRVRKESVIVIGVDALEVRESVGSWLVTREENGLAASGENRSVLADSSGNPLWESAPLKKNSLPPHTFPVANRLGTWRYQVWPDPVVSHRWNEPFLYSGIALAFCVLVGAVVVAMSLQRATLLAEQRVTFVNRVSHELRTPITNILLNTDLARELVDTDPDDTRGRLDRIRGETARLSRLVDNVLTFSRRGKGTDQLAACKVVLSEALREVLANFEEMLESASIVVKNEVNESLVISADRDAVIQISNNLLSNVEKYGKSGGLLLLSSLEANGMGILRVEDRGPGIDRKMRQKIFEPFRRSGDFVNEGVSGTGLGLTIARDLAREMGGDLVLVDSKGGAAFELSLPLYKS